MEDYNFQQNLHPCNFQEIMELCSVAVSNSPTINTDNRHLMNNINSVSAWQRSFVNGSGQDEAVCNIGRAGDGRWSNIGLPPFGKMAGGGETSSGVGKDGENSDQILYGRNVDPNMDPRKLKRIMSNRVSAQKSRLKKVQYVADMERKLKSLEAHVAILSPQVELFRNQQHLLQMEQKRLNQKLLCCSRNKLIKDAEIEENRAELYRLRELHRKLQEDEANEWDSSFQMQQPNLHASQFTNLISPPPNQADNVESAVEGNGLGGYNPIARFKTEYKWMPTPGLRQVSEPINQLGQMERPN